jgi:transcriptional regulator with XRE-family HTH domain
MQRLAHGVGLGIAALRDRHGARQEDVAAAARELGLPWTQPVIAALETGRRRLDAEELVLLPLVLARCLGRPVSLSEVLPAAAVSAGGVDLDPAAVRGLLGGSPGDPEGAAALVLRAELEQALDAQEEALRRAARRLGVSPDALTTAAFGKWGHGLIPERDIRVETQAPPDASRRTLQAIRGHVTRELLDELRPIIDEEA